MHSLFYHRIYIFYTGRNIQEFCNPIIFTVQNIFFCLLQIFGDQDFLGDASVVVARFWSVGSAAKLCCHFGEMILGISPCSPQYSCIFGVDFNNLYEVLYLNHSYLIDFLFSLFEEAIYVNFIQFKFWICRDLRTFDGVKFGLKDLLCVKNMKFCNSECEVKLDFLAWTVNTKWVSN